MAVRRRNNGYRINPVLPFAFGLCHRSVIGVDPILGDPKLPCRCERFLATSRKDACNQKISVIEAHGDSVRPGDARARCTSNHPHSHFSLGVVLAWLRI